MSLFRTLILFSLFIHVKDTHSHCKPSMLGMYGSIFIIVHIRKKLHRKNDVQVQLGKQKCKQNMQQELILPHVNHIEALTQISPKVSLTFDSCSMCISACLPGEKIKIPYGCSTSFCCCYYKKKVSRSTIQYSRQHKWVFNGHSSLSSKRCVRFITFSRPSPTTCTGKNKVLGLLSHLMSWLQQ